MSQQRTQRRRPRAVVFDLDDTLCDYASSRRYARAAVERLLSRQGVDIASFWDRYAEAKVRLFASGESHTVRQDRYELQCFCDALPADLMQREDLAVELRDQYKATVLASLRPVPGAERALRAAASRCRPAVLTNGPSATQRAKVARLRIPRAVCPAIYISAEIGLSKPDPRAFQYVLRALRARPSDAMMVGDSIEKDLLPAASLGMQTVLFAPNGGVPADWPGPSISQLDELLVRL